MGDVNIPYYRTKGGAAPGSRRMAYWAPCLARPDRKTGIFEPTLMAKLGFVHQELGEDGPAAWAAAQNWNAKWKAARGAHLAGAKPLDAVDGGRVWPANSVGEAFAKFRRIAAWKGKPERTREDWLRGWAHIAPIFGDRDPRELSLEDLDLWYAGDPDDAAIQGLLQRLGVREAHRVVKIWRALWKIIATIKRPDGETYCVRDADPSLGIRRKTPKGRSDIWFEGEVVRLVKRAVRMRFHGLAAALAVAWDTMLSPIDVVSLSRAKLTSDEIGPLLDVDRTKTGAPAVCTLSRRTFRLVTWYVARLPAPLDENTPFFHTRGGKPGPRGGRPRLPAPYTVNKLGQDFRVVRDVEFPGDERQVMDLRRSGAVEARAGAAHARIDLRVLAGAMANTIDTSGSLRATYLPPDATATRAADDARAIGRRRLRLVAGGRK